jgi:hypothetical protein
MSMSSIEDKFHIALEYSCCGPALALSHVHTYDSVSECRQITVSPETR